ncbi:MAG: hypothetical protein JWM09_138, partial [Francisellaceae bacterium]|nr:hypothetical protein [Francisellaceae bacterium]
MDLTTLYCDVDDFFKVYSIDKQTIKPLENGKRTR